MAFWSEFMNLIKRISTRLMTFFVFFVFPTVQAEVEPDGLDDNSYYFVSTHEVEVNSRASVIWPHLINLGSWMYEFELSHVSGPVGQAGEVLRLYPGQAFYIQILKAEVGTLLIMANLPSTFRGELSTGIGVMRLIETEEGTRVSLTMTRRYTSLEVGENSQKSSRESEAFQERTRAMWEDRFLNRLKTLSESGQ